MIHTLTLIITPLTPAIPELRTTMRDVEKFAFKNGTLVTSDDSKSVMGIACADFHDVSVALERSEGMRSQRVYIQDGRGHLFLFKPIQNTLTSLGYTVGYGEQDNVPSGMSYFDFGSIRHAFVERKDV